LKIANRLPHQSLSCSVLMAEGAASHRLAFIEDILECVALHLDVTSAVNLLKTDKYMSKRQEIRYAVPHPHIRSIVGIFPHQRGVSLDRNDLIKGIKRRKHRNFVLKRTAVRIYIDFGTWASRPLSLKSFHGPLHPTEAQWVNQVALDRLKKTRAKWEAMEGPSESFENEIYFKREPYTRFFTEPLQYKLELVYAETCHRVSCDTFENALDMSSSLLRNDGIFSQPSPKPRGYFAQCAQELPPAYAKVHVPHLSSEHENQLFRIRVVGSGFLRGDNSPVQLSSLSEPFECVSKPAVIQKACTRKAKR